MVVMSMVLVVVVVVMTMVVRVMGVVVPIEKFVLLQTSVSVHFPPPHLWVG